MLASCHGFSKFKMCFCVWIEDRLLGGRCLAFGYANIFRQVAGEFGIEAVAIEETPMKGLIEFHASGIEES